MHVHKLVRVVLENSGSNLYCPPDRQDNYDAVTDDERDKYGYRHTNIEVPRDEIEHPHTHEPAEMCQRILHRWRIVTRESYSPRRQYLFSRQAQVSEPERASTGGGTYPQDVTKCGLSLVLTLKIQHSLYVIR